MYHKTIGLLILSFAISIVNAQNPAADSLSHDLFVKAKTAKADSLTSIALAVAKPGADNKQLTQALAQIDQALHIYSKYRALDGVRQSFDNLAFVYRLQKKHSQEKWYILQSNTLSRDRLDTPNIINSLIRLAAVKRDIKDYDLAARDMNEVAYLAQKTANAAAQISALKSLSDIYQATGNLKRSADMLNKVAYLQDSLRRNLDQQKVTANNIEQNQTRASLKANKAPTGVNGNFIKYIVLIISILIVAIFIFYLTNKGRNEGKPGA